MEFTTMNQAFAVIGATFALAPFHLILQPLIEEVLAEQGLNRFRKGTILIPKLLIWLVLLMVLRRDLSTDKALSWMVSGYRWIKNLLPAKSQIVTDGAISKARVRLGIEPFRVLLDKQTSSFDDLPQDFHGRTTLILDGATISMPDTKENRDHFKKPSSQKGQAGFPLVRMMALLAFPVRLVLDIAYAPYSGKGSGERTLVMKLIEAITGKGFLLLLDAGLYSFKLMYTISQQGNDFILKAPINATLKPVEHLPDGSYIAIIEGQIEDLDKPPRKDGKKNRKKVKIKVRVVRFEIPGFRPVRLVTSILDSTVTAHEIIVHYHKRWDIEITYDEIKTHQCATLKGQAPTVLRSKRPDLVEQELIAMIIMYNAVRSLIWQAATKHDKDPRNISFLAALQHLIDAIPMLTAQDESLSENKCSYLLELIADCEIDRPRRPRVNPRVVKIKSKKWPRKNSKHKCIERHLEKEITILAPKSSEKSDNSSPSDPPKEVQISKPNPNEQLVLKNVLMEIYEIKI